MVIPSLKQATGDVKRHTDYLSVDIRLDSRLSVMGRFFSWPLGNYEYPTNIDCSDIKLYPNFGKDITLNRFSKGPLTVQLCASELYTELLIFG